MAKSPKKAAKKSGPAGRPSRAATKAPARKPKAPRPAKRTKPAATGASAKTGTSRRRPKPTAKPPAPPATRTPRAGEFVPAPQPPEPPQQTAARELAIAAARSLSDDKCTDVVVIDVRGRSSLTDFVVVASGTSDRQMRSAADSVRVLARQANHQVVRESDDDRTTWVVLDCVDVVVHVFEPTTRAHYDLEMMWGDAPRVEWARAEPPTAPARRRAPASA